jgi:hypothetical protein
MSTGDIGESLVGAYMRHVEKCSIVIYNSFFAEQQGEVDVVGVKPGEPGEPRTVYLCEVTTHIDGLNPPLIARVPGKLNRLREFADETFPGEHHVYQWWSPNVPPGVRLNAFERIQKERAEEGQILELVFNAEYTARITALVEAAKTNSSTTNEPAFRMLQVLTRLRGVKPRL